MRNRYASSNDDFVVNAVAKVLAALIIAAISYMVTMCSTSPAAVSEYKVVFGMDAPKRSLDYVCQKRHADEWHFCVFEGSRVYPEALKVPQGFKPVAGAKDKSDTTFFCQSLQNPEEYWTCEIGDNPKILERVDIPKGWQLIEVYLDGSYSDDYHYVLKKIGQNQWRVTNLHDEGETLSTPKGEIVAVYASRSGPSYLCWLSSEQYGDCY